MKRLQEAGYLLFVVSNQPNQAKRKATRADHDAIQAKLAAALDAAGITVERILLLLPSSQRRGAVAVAVPAIAASRRPIF